MFVSRESTKVLYSENDKVVITENDFGKGKGIYMSDFDVNDDTTRMLLDLVLDIAGDKNPLYITDNKLCECTYYPGSDTLVVINNSDVRQTTTVKTKEGNKTYTIEAYDTVIDKL